MLRAVPWLRRLVIDLSPRRPVFEPGSMHVGFVVDKVALGQVFLRVLRFFPCQYHSTVFLHTHISSGGWTVCPLAAAVQRRSLAPSKINKKSTIGCWGSVHFRCSAALWSRVLYEKLTVGQLVKKRNTGGPLLCSQDPAAGPYSDEPSSHPRTFLSIF
jgi:hypothetical protein